MKIERIDIDGFGCHKDFSLSFRGDFNLLYGKNESGKSTVLAFIETVLYGFDTEDRNFWRPWNGGPFGGTMTFTAEGIPYKVAVSWGVTKEEDRVVVTNRQTGEQTVLQGKENVGETILKLPRESFRLFARGHETDAQDDGEIIQLAALTQGADSSQNGEDTGEMQRLSAYKEKLTAKVQALNAQKAQLSERYEKRVKAEEEALRLEERIAHLEQQHAILSKKDTKIQSMDALTAAVTLLEKQKKVHQFSHTVDDLQMEYEDAKDQRRAKKRPWTVLLIILLIVDVLALVAMWLPAEWLPAFLPFSEMTAGAYMIAGFTAGGLLLVLSLALIVLRTSGKGNLALIEEELAYKEQALWDLLGLRQPSYEEVDRAIQDLDAQCIAASQCIAAIDQERQDKADLASKVSALAQKITYDRAQSEMLARFMGNEQAAQEIAATQAKIEEAISVCGKHIAAVDLAKALILGAQRKRRYDLAPRLSQQSGTYLDGLTSGRYKAVELSRVLEPQVRVDGVVRGGKHYSGATGKQLNLSVKLAEIKLLAESGLKLPLILDEPMAVYDEERRSASLETLLRFAKDHDIQIILTTSQTKAPCVAAYDQYALSI